MSGIFSVDNPVFTVIGKIVDVIALSIVWLLLCIPVVTIGASTTALYYTTVKVIRRDRSYLFKEFFKAFKNNFKYSTIITVIVLALAAILYFDFNFSRLMMGILPQERFDITSVAEGNYTGENEFTVFKVNGGENGQTTVREEQKTGSNGVTYMRALNLGGEGTVNSMNVSITVEGKTTVSVFALNNTEGKGQLFILDESGDLVTSQEIQSENEYNIIPKVSLTIPSAGTYYLCASSEEVDIYFISYDTLIETSDFSDKMGYVMYIVFSAMSIILVLVLVFIFPVLSRFTMGFKQLLKNTFFMALKHFPTSLLLVIIIGGSILLTWLLWPIPVFLFLPGVASLLCSFLIERVFKKYMPSKEEFEDSGKDLWYLE